MREKKYKECLDEYHKTRPDFIELAKNFSEEDNEIIYAFIKRKKGLCNR